MFHYCLTNRVPVTTHQVFAVYSFIMIFADQFLLCVLFSPRFHLKFIFTDSFYLYFILQISSHLNFITLLIQFTIRILALFSIYICHLVYSVINIHFQTDSHQNHKIDNELNQIFSNTNVNFLKRKFKISNKYAEIRKKINSLFSSQAIIFLPFFSFSLGGVHFNFI